MTTTRLNVSLEQYEVGISGAVPDRADWKEPAMDRAILEFVALFCGIVFKYGGRIVHGCHPTFQPVILHQARLHAGKRERPPVTLVMSNLWAQRMPAEERASFEDVAEFIVTRQVGDGSPSNAKTRNESLTAMRRVLISGQNVMVAVGGKMHYDDGKAPGVLEEMELARVRNLPRFLLAGLGGYAKTYASELSPKSLSNGLSREQNLVLLDTADVSACVNILFEHLARSSVLSKMADQPVRWNPGNRAVVDHRDGTVDAESTGLVMAPGFQLRAGEAGA